MYERRSASSGGRGRITGQSEVEEKEHDEQNHSLLPFQRLTHLLATRLDSISGYPSIKRISFVHLEP